jgi:excisionase family DNA binding protein
MTVRNWIDRGELPAVRVGSRRVRIRRSDLDRFLEAGATAPPGKHFAVIVLRDGKAGPEYQRVLGPFPVSQGRRQVVRG